jgi:hypothetical protein
MKKIILSLAFLTSIFIATAQVPQAINYQAVARTSLGLLLPNQQISVRFTILEGSATGNMMYQETATTTTNNYGLFTLGIGLGTPSFGTFSNINWATGLLKYLKVEIAVGGAGTSYAVQGTTVMLSVPYSLYSEKTRLIGGNAVTITNGNTINGAYKGLSGILISNDTISGAYTGTNGVAVNGSVISGAYIAGSGINISGNVISATGGGGGGNLWIPDANGIYYQNSLGGVGIGGNTESNGALTVTQRATGGFSGGIVLKSSDTWHTVMRIDNTSTSPFGSMQFNLAGSGNSAMPARSFSLYDGMANRFIWNTDGTNNGFLAIGSPAGVAQLAKSRLHVFVGDVNIDQIGSGIIMKSSNGQCWRITIDNTGNLIRTAITCP